MGIRREGKPGKLTPEEAHRRMLARYGLNPQWWSEQLAMQENKCAECKQPMSKPVLDSEGKRILCRLCSMVKNQRNKRERDQARMELAAAKEAAKKTGPQTGDEFWKQNRNTLSEADKTRCEELDSEIILLWGEVKACLEAAKTGREFDEPALRDFVKEVCQSLLDNGTTFVDLVLVDFFRPEFKDTYEQYVNEGGPTALFVQFGYITAIPSSDAHRFLEFSERHYGLPIAQFETFPTRIGRIYDVLDYGKGWQPPNQVIKCEVKGCKETKNLPPFRVPSAQWWCPTHQAENDKAAHAALIRIGERQLTQQRNDSVYDSWRRFKDLERETIYDDAGRYDG